MKGRNEDAIPVVRRHKEVNNAPQKKAPPPPKRKKVKIDYSDIEVSEYYLKAAKKYRVAKMLTFVVLIAFLAANLLFFRENITYNNMMYLLRDLDTGVSAPSGEFASISYNEESSSAYGIFKGRLAIAHSSGFALYNSTGSRELEEKGHMQNPAIEAGEKYAVAYDVGGHSYSIYTTMARVLEKQSDDIIENACVSDSGNYAIVTRSNEAKYLVSVYKENLKLHTSYYKEKLVVDVALDSSGKKLVIVSADVDVSSVYTEIVLAKPGSEETETLTVENAMPLAAAYMEDGELLVLCDSKLVAVSDGKVTEKYAFGGTPELFYMAKDSVAVVCSENAVATDCSVYLFDKNGNMTYNVSVEEKLTDVACDSGAIYVMSDEMIYAYYTDNTVKSAEGGATVNDIVPLYSSLLKCEKLGTSLISFE